MIHGRCVPEDSGAGMGPGGVVRSAAAGALPCSKARKRVLQNAIQQDGNPIVVQTMQKQDGRRSKVDAKERPIIFDRQMIMALLSGSKTQMRRLVKPQPSWESGNTKPTIWYVWRDKSQKQLQATLDESSSANVTETVLAACPFGVPGDRLWVKERLWANRLGTTIYEADGCPVMVNGESVEWRWKAGVLPAMSMSRAHSRITLEITDVRVERLRSIDEQDAAAEGTPRCEHGFDYCTRGCGTPAERLCVLWNATHKSDGPHGWDANPWVWVLSIRRL